MASKRKHSPISLWALSLFFIATGTTTWIDLIVAAVQGRGLFNAAVLCLPIGIGLLLHSPPWRTWALLYLAIGLITSPLLMAFTFFSPSPQHTPFLGITATLPRSVLLASTALSFLISVWGIFVLSRPTIRELFAPRHS